MQDCRSRHRDSKWFNNARSFGFITRDGGGKDVFAHHKAIQPEGFRALAKGQKVEFDVTADAVRGVVGIEGGVVSGC